MGLILFPDLIRREAASSTAAMEADNSGYVRALNAIDEYLNDDQLQGAGWDAMRRHLSGHRTVIRALLLANKAMIEANETVSDKVGEEILIEDKLRAKIRCLENINKALRVMIAALTAAMCGSPHNAGYYRFLIRECEEHIRINLNQIAILEGKIEKLYRIEAETADLFDKADGLYGKINSAIAALRQGYDPGMNTYSLGVGYSEFEESINKQWKEGFKEIENKYRYVIERIDTEKFFENIINPVVEWLSDVEIRQVEIEDTPVIYVTEEGTVLENGKPLSEGYPENILMNETNYAAEGAGSEAAGAVAAFAAEFDFEESDKKDIIGNVNDGIVDMGRLSVEDICSIVGDL